MRLLTLSLAALALAAPAAGHAQAGLPASLTLEEALRLAKQNNPSYLQTMNARQRSQNAVRNAYGAFLPSASTNIGTSYRQGKPQFFAGVQFGSNSDIMSSSWGLNVNASMSANTLANLRRTQANEDASDNDVRDAEQALVSGVTQQYLFVLQDRKSTRLNSSHIPLSRMPSSA